MEALAAVGLASNVAQFLEYGITMVRLTSQIMRSTKGTSQQMAELELVATDITQTLQTINKAETQYAGGRRDEVLHKLVARCLELSTQIIDIVNGLKMQKNVRPRVFEGAHKTGLSMYKKKELEHLSGQLSALRTQVTSHLTLLIDERRQQQCGIQETLRKFSASNEEHQETCDMHLRKVMRYFESITHRFNQNTSIKSSISMDEAQDALSFYMEQSILESLKFSQLHDRELQIPEAHRRTFECVFDSTTHLKFADWLSSQSGIFWVAGKTGSGKSSLMKFITEHPTTYKLLSRWADGNLVVAKHYFWNPGTTLQKSQDGLLRTCLLQILSARPKLISTVCKDRWAGSYANSSSPWTHSELLKAMDCLKATAGESSSQAFRICLFIDGVDEYDGDHVDLIKTLSGLAECSNIKICVSSRPWREFLDAFDGSPWKLYLQDLTRQDIARYVRDKLEEDAGFKRLQSSANTVASDIINDVTIRSKGVFLWVYWAVRSLLRGLRDEDDLAVLQRRVEALPVDLSEFFKQMLESIEDVYRQRTARLLLALSSARRSLPVLTFFFLNIEDPMQPAEPQDLKFLKDWPDTDTSHFEGLITKKRQLVAQCKDMIHIAPDPEGPVLFGERVAFPHRSIVDFINTDETYNQLQQLAGPSFDPLKALFDADLGQAQSFMHLHRLTYIRDQLSQWILGCFFYAYRIELTSSSPPEQVNPGLDELEKTILQDFGHWGFSHAMNTLLDDGDIISFISLAAKCDLASYVKYKLPQLTGDTLDELAPGWRTPSCVQQHSGFELCPQAADGNCVWRLGRSVGLFEGFENQKKSSQDEAPEEVRLQRSSMDDEVVNVDSQNTTRQQKLGIFKRFTVVFR